MILRLLLCHYTVTVLSLLGSKNHYVANSISHTSVSVVPYQYLLCLEELWIGFHPLLSLCPSCMVGTPQGELRFTCWLLCLCAPKRDCLYGPRRLRRLVFLVPLAEKQWNFLMWNFEWLHCYQSVCWSKLNIVLNLFERIFKSCCSGLAGSGLEDAFSYSIPAQCGCALECFLLSCLLLAFATLSTAFSPWCFYDIRLYSSEQNSCRGLSRGPSCGLRPLQHSRKVQKSCMHALGSKLSWWAWKQHLRMPTELPSLPATLQWE